MSYRFELPVVGRIDVVDAYYRYKGTVGDFKIGDFLDPVATISRLDVTADHVLTNSDDAVSSLVNAHDPDLFGWLNENVRGRMTFVGRIVAWDYPPYSVIVAACIGFEDQADAALFATFFNFRRADD